MQKKSLNNNNNNFGIGIDIIEISRINDNLADKILTIDEYNRYIVLKSMKRKAEFLAGRWAIKEAYYKATGKRIPFNKINVQTNSNIAPTIVIEGKKENVSSSISHNNTTAVAVVICINNNKR